MWPKIQESGISFRDRLVSHAVYLHLAVDDHSRDYACPGRWMTAEVLFEYRIERCKIAWILKPNTAPHNMLRAIPGFMEDRQKISDCLSRLNHDVS
jgi:hypothetical protein